jgi:hypothetical protein
MMLAGARCGLAGNAARCYELSSVFNGITRTWTPSNIWRC